jgi:hypothetical protein
MSDENLALKRPLIFTLPTWGFVVALSLKEISGLEWPALVPPRKRISRKAGLNQPLRKRLAPSARGVSAVFSKLLTNPIGA